MAVPFPPRAFPAPELHPADRGSAVALENGTINRGFAIALENGTIVNGYLRRNDPQHEFAYERYQKVIDLGQKGKILYGRIYERSDEAGLYSRTEQIVVIKKLSKSWLRCQQGAENPLVEIAVSQMIGDNHHVVEMHEALQDNKYYYMVMTYFGTDLFDALQVATPNHVPLLQTLVQNLLYLQQHNIIHRDLSPENIIVDSDLHEARCPLIDFAMALQCAMLEGNTLRIVPQTIASGKWPYMSPEVYRGAELGFGVDVWALGCTLFLLWTGQHLYEHPSDRCWEFFIENNGIERALHIDMDIWMSVPNLPPDFTPVMVKFPLVQGLDDEQRDLLSKMLHMDPSERITAREILQHGYLQQQL